MRLAHFVQDYRRAVLRSDLELSAYVVFYQLTDKLIVLVLHEVVIAYS